MIRRTFIAALAAAIVMPGIATAQSMPSAERILRQLEAAPQNRVAPERRVTVDEFKRRPELRRAAPSIDIQSINFASSTSCSAVSPTLIRQSTLDARSSLLILYQRYIDQL